MFLHTGCYFQQWWIVVGTVWSCRGAVSGAALAWGALTRFQRGAGVAYEPGLFLGACQNLALSIVNTH